MIHKQQDDMKTMSNTTPKWNDYRVISNGELIHSGNDYRQALSTYMEAIKKGGMIANVAIWHRSECITSN